jgi:hypothetical protein
MFWPTTEPCLSGTPPRRTLRLGSLVVVAAVGLMAGLLPAPAFGEEVTGVPAAVEPTAAISQEAPEGQVAVDQSLAITEEATGGPVEVEETAATTATCTDPVIANPFTEFGDFRDYVLAPFGDFEDPALPGWILEGGAHTVIDGDGALRLPPGSTATSPAMCIDLNYPTMRFFVRDALGVDARLKTQVMYVDHESAYTPHTVGKLRAMKDWGLTEDIAIDPERGGEEAGWRRIAFRFVSNPYGGDIRVDDLWVDPRMR